jgi:hypothetical protein
MCAALRLFEAITDWLKWVQAPAIVETANVLGNINCIIAQEEMQTEEKGKATFSPKTIPRRREG